MTDDAAADDGRPQPAVPVEPLDYEGTDRYDAVARVAAVRVLATAGVLLVFFGGCFCIGIMICVAMLDLRGWAIALQSLLGLLFVAAVGCLGGGGWMLFRVARDLARRFGI